MDKNGLSGLIPSQQLEEKRKAFVKPEHDYTHKSCMYAIASVRLGMCGDIHNI